MGRSRDFVGYGGRPPHPRWPGAARVALSVVVNVEEGAELSLTAGDERNESRYEVVDEVVGATDPCMESHFEYGTRAGYWRIMEVLGRFGVRATMNACARALLHLRIIGRPGRIAALERFLEHVMTAGQAWLATRADIAGHWRGLHGL